VGRLDFAALRERLLQSGVAPRHVRRTVAELQDHHADLVSEGESRGSTSEQAAALAFRRLGDEEALVAEILARSELRSWAHQWPWAIYGLAPLLILVAAIIGGLAALFLPIYFHTRISGPAWTPPGWVQGLSAWVRHLSMYGLPLIVAAGVCWEANRRRASAPWPMVGVMLVSLLGGALDLDIRWPGAGHPGALSVALSVLPPFPNIAEMFVRTATSCLLVFAPFLWLRARRATPAG
jgi:hypothetical protein